MTAKTSKPAVCVAGKNELACRFLEWLTVEFGDDLRLFVVANRDDTGKHTWQPSLRFTARQLRIEELSLEQAYSLPDAIFLSLEFDRIVDPRRFRTAKLYNLHFSLLPSYRGVGTSVWPILKCDGISGVTLHHIDEGIDTGDIVCQQAFAVPAHWCARDLYFAYMRCAYELIAGCFEQVLGGSLGRFPQPVEGATYYGKRDADYQTLRTIDFANSAWQIAARIRALTFHEYQYPCHVELGDIYRPLINGRRSSAKPGCWRRRGKWLAEVETLDQQVEVLLSPWSALTKWCRGEGSNPFANERFPCKLDLDRSDRNGWTLLNVAAFHGSTAAIEMLVELGADVNATGLCGTTNLMYAKECFLQTGNTRPFDALLSLGASPDQADVHGKTLIDYLAKDSQAAVLCERLTA